MLWSSPLCARNRRYDPCPQGKSGSASFPLPKSSPDFPRSSYPDKGKPYKSKEDENKRKHETKMLKTAHQALWKPYIKSVISNLVKTTSSLVVFLWGEDAKSTFLDCVNEKIIESKILILSTSHPSNTGNAKGLGFLKDAPRHFELCNEFLKRNNEKEIYWKDLRKIYQG